MIQKSIQFLMVHFVTVSILEYVSLLSSGTYIRGSPDTNRTLPWDRFKLRSLIIAFVFFSYIANLIIASAQIARRGGLLIE